MRMGKQAPQRDDQPASDNRNRQLCARLVVHFSRLIDLTASEIEKWLSEDAKGQSRLTVRGNAVMARHVAAVDSMRTIEGIIRLKHYLEMWRELPDGFGLIGSLLNNHIDGCEFIIQRLDAVVDYVKAGQFAKAYEHFSQARIKIRECATSFSNAGEEEQLPVSGDEEDDADFEDPIKASSSPVRLDNPTMGDPVPKPLLRDFPKLQNYGMENVVSTGELAQIAELKLSTIRSHMRPRKWLPKHEKRDPNYYLPSPDRRGKGQQQNFYRIEQIIPWLVALRDSRKQ